MKNEIKNELENLLNVWFPRSIDTVNGGYLCNFTYDWKAVEPLDKFVVTQCRILWTASKAAIMFPDNSYYLKAAEIGYEFIRDYFWDEEFGGFHSMRNQQGGYSDYENYDNEKRVYGNAYGIFSLSAYYKATKNEEALDLAKKVFYWIENNAHDKVHKGYFQFLTREGKPFGNEKDSKVKDAQQGEAGYKDQNSSIHLLEAFTELYSVWKNDLLKERLNELLVLIRDTITDKKGYLKLFFTQDWEHIDYSNVTIREKIHDHLDHISFGHDVETGFLMLEASHTLGLKNDLKTLNVATQMVQHALKNAWDINLGGFYDEGLYPNGGDECKIIMDGKVWWAQAECMNMLLLMSKIVPEDVIYIDRCKQIWKYIKQYLIDIEHGDWYEGGLDKQPELKTAHKATIWKGPYHNGRALMNCLKMLDSNFDIDNELSELINHWKVMT